MEEKILGSFAEDVSAEELKRAALYITHTILLCSCLPGRFVDRIQEGSGDPQMVALLENHDPEEERKMVCHIQGNQLNVLNLDDGEDRDITVSTYADPLYANLEEFVRLAENNARAGMWVDPYGDRICYIYDNGPLVAVTVDKDGNPLEEGYYTGGNMAYAYNWDSPQNSEWGICEAFPMYSETVAEQRERQQRTFDQLLDALSDSGNVGVTIIGPNGPVDSIPAGAKVTFGITHKDKA